MKYLIIALTIFSSLANAEVVKQSKSGICHDSSSPHYERTNNFKAFESMPSCLASDGRLPKRYSQDQVQSENGYYSRSKFGHGWADIDGDCQNTRQEILIELSTSLVGYDDSNLCRVIHGRWISMYSGKVFTDASKLDVDHIVPLKWAWDHGASVWSQEKRELFANDPINLVAVEATLNRSKGAKGPDEWLPPSNQEQYKARFKRILLRYDLSGI